VASRPSLAVAARPSCPEVAVSGNAGLMGPFNCVDRDGGRTGPRAESARDREHSTPI
jgi:hypothetical protein